MGQTQTIGTHKTSQYFNEEGFFTVRYHATEVFKHKHENGFNTIILNSGGWKTNTTKTRINQALNELGLPFSVYQKNYEWYILNTNTKQVIDFEDKIVLTY